MVGLLHQRDEDSSRQNETGPPLPDDLAIDAEVDVGPTPGAYGLAARLNVSLPGIEVEVAQRLLEAADQLCPYSNATRGNIDVTVKLV
jgi:organic hydroperoxide reductase OsmC/OhrA